MKLLKSTATVGSATVLSRILGFVRDVVLAKIFGASGDTDAFFLAFKIPNFMRRLFAEGSFSLAFVPVLSEYKATGDRAALRDLVDHVTGTLASVLLILATIGVIAAPLVLSIFAPGWLAEGRPGGPDEVGQRGHDHQGRASQAQRALGSIRRFAIPPERRRFSETN